MRTEYWDFLQFLTIEEVGLMTKGIFLFVKRIDSFEDAHYCDLVNLIITEIIPKGKFTTEITVRFSELLQRVAEDIIKDRARYLNKIAMTQKGGKK